MNLDFVEQQLAGIGALQAVGPAHSVTSFDDVRDQLPQALYHPVREVFAEGGIDGRALRRNMRFAIVIIAEHTALEPVRQEVLLRLNGYRPTVSTTPVVPVEGEVIEAIGQTVIWRDIYQFADTMEG